MGPLDKRNNEYPMPLPLSKTFFKGGENPRLKNRLSSFRNIGDT